MAGKRSATLEKVLQLATGFAEKYTTARITQTHVMLAFLKMYADTGLKMRENEEFKRIMQEFPVSEADQLEMIDKSYTWLKQTPAVPFREVRTLRKTLESAETYVRLAEGEQITLDRLIGEILSMPSPLTEELFAPLFRISHVVSDQPFDELLFDEIFAPEEEQPPEPIATSSQLWPLKNLQSSLRQEVYGQDEAINAVVSGCFNLFLNEGQSLGDKPKATFLFAGAPGVGKTHLAQTTAKALQLPFRRFDMSSFGDKESPLEFAGSDKVFRASHEGLVTGFVRKNPKCVLLFDEIEKAHINVIHLFLQILDAGKLKDSHTGENVLFGETVIIMTTNAGRSLYQDLEPGSPMPNRKTVVNALSTEVNPVTGEKFFPEAICSRFASGNIVLFNPLGVQSLLKIGQAAIAQKVELVEKKFPLKVVCDKNLCAALLFAEGGRADARSLSGRASNFISAVIYNWLKYAYERDEQALDKTETLRVRIPAQGDAKELLEPKGAQNILLYSENADAFNNFASNESIHLMQAESVEKAMELVQEYDIAFAVCDIFGDEQPTLNIEDTASEGRKLMEKLVQSHVPTYVFCSPRRIINQEERHALLKNGAMGFVEHNTKSAIQSTLKNLCQQVHTETKLRQLSRSKKVLSFDCVYNWEKGRKAGTIDLMNLRMIPAIDAEDKDDIADLCMTDTTFDDVIGAEDAKAELKGFISYLKDPKLYARNHIPAPKGVLLFGPPGTGKTMLAKAFAHESGAAFIATHGNQFLSGKPGGGAQEVRRLFAMARKYAPAVLFIDEIDIVARSRFTSSNGDDAVNALLNEMDGFSTNSSRPVFVLGATNFDAGFGRESVLDSALLRRFDRRIFVDMPNAAERKAFLQMRLKESKQDVSDPVVDNIISRSVGMSLAELESVVDFALRSMVRAGQTVLTEQLLNEAFETFRYGEQAYQNEELLKRVAFHESGHAILSHLEGLPPCYITIAGRGEFGGYSLSVDEERSVQTKKYLLGRIRTALAGRAAELIVYGDEEGLSTGAANDLRMATETAMRIISTYGMSREAGLISDPDNNRKETVDLCKQMLDEQMDRTLDALRQKEQTLRRLAQALLERNHLLGHELEEILQEKE
ncbi:MAG: AAA family ATPase [Oscillospiraceae bacterium]|nr:AAA family ATPase [Oscillospiraceae bacterium]